MREEKRMTVNNISQYFTSVYEDDLMKCTESCWIIEGGGRERERAIDGVDLIKVQYMVKYHGETPMNN
jgi:hypothetical protein